MNKFRIVSILCLLGLLVMFLAPVAVTAAVPPQPTYGTATVDGDAGEWDLTNDFFADMYRAANSGMKVESKLYLRYDCENRVLYALVLPVEDVPVLAEPDNTFVKLGNSTTLVDGNDNNDGIPQDFAWINSHYDDTLGMQIADGWEASCELDEGTYNNLNVHTNVWDDGESQTSAVDDRSIDLVIDCEPVGTTTTTTTTTAEVGGEVYPTDKAAMLAPWIILAAALGAVGAILYLRKRNT
jgi:hypothetical protein